LERSIESLANGLPVAGAPPGSAEAILVQSQSNEIKQLRAQIKKQQKTHQAALTAATNAAAEPSGGGKDVWRQRWQEQERETRQLRKALIAAGVSPLAMQQGKWGDADDHKDITNAAGNKHSPVRPTAAAMVVANASPQKVDSGDDNEEKEVNAINGDGNNNTDALTSEIATLRTRLRELGARREHERHKARTDLEAAQKQVYNINLHLHISILSPNQ
jgi:hypothetical protein